MFVIGESQNAEEMIEQAQKRHWNIVILDVGMPGKSGLEALKELKHLHPKLPVLVLSAYPRISWRSGCSKWCVRLFVERQRPQ